MRGAYDVFLLGNKLQSKIDIEDDNLSKELIAGLESYNSIMSISKNIEFNSNKQSKLFTKEAISNLDAKFKTQLNRKIITFFIWLKKRIVILIKTLYNKSYFLFVSSRITDINWYKKKLNL